MHYDVADILVSTTRKGIYAVHGADDQHMPGVVAQLTELPVTVLRLLSSQISDHTVAMLARLSQLKELNLEDAPVTDRGIGALGPLKELQILNLKGTRSSIWRRRKSPMPRSTICLRGRNSPALTFPTRRSVEPAWTSSIACRISRLCYYIGRRSRLRNSARSPRSVRNCRFAFVKKANRQDAKTPRRQERQERRDQMHR